MKKIEPYNSISQANKMLDNGGRFYNVLTKPQDGEITSAELGKVAGLFNDKQKMVLFLELAISKLSDNYRKEVISSLTIDLQEIYKGYKPLYLTLAEANNQVDLSKNVIVTGIPKLIDSKSDFNGFIMIPIMVGKVMTFTLIPIIDEYDVYEITDKQTSNTILIAHARGKQKLPKNRVVVAGIMKELKKSENEEKASKKFLEVSYYMDSE